MEIRSVFQIRGWCVYKMIVLRDCGNVLYLDCGGSYMNTVMPWYPWGTGYRTLSDTKI